MNIFLLPFAGGSKYSYHSFIQSNSLPVSFIPLELPGRGTRIEESLLEDIELHADDIFNQILPYITNAPYAIFGHSMGAILSFLILERLVRKGVAMPSHVFFSGCSGPSVYRINDIYLLPKKNFFEQVEKIGGSISSIFSNDELLNYIEPILRADLKALYHFKYNHHHKFDVPATVLIGSSEGITDKNALAWQKEIKYPVKLKKFEGGHFFIFDHSHEIVRMIATSVNLT